WSLVRLRAAGSSVTALIASRSIGKVSGTAVHDEGRRGVHSNTSSLADERGLRSAPPHLVVLTVPPWGKTSIPEPEQQRDRETTSAESKTTSFGVPQDAFRSARRLEDLAAAHRGATDLMGSVLG